MDSVNQSFFVIDRFENSYQAEIIKSLLADYEIKAEVVNAETNILHPLMISGSFDVRLIANIEDKERIEEILTSHYNEK